MSKSKVKKDDEVIILKGNDRGKTGKVKQVIEKQRIIVEGVNVQKKHLRGNPQAGKPGGIVDKELPIHISNAALLVSGKGAKKFSKVGVKFLDDGKKVRYFKANGELVDL